MVKVIARYQAPVEETAAKPKPKPAKEKKPKAEPAKAAEKKTALVRQPYTTPVKSKLLGDPVMVQDKDDKKWYPALARKVVKAGDKHGDGTTYSVGMVTFGWTGPYSTAKIEATPATNVREFSPPMVGQNIYAMSGGDWYEAKVEKIDGNKVDVIFIGYESDGVYDGLRWGYAAIPNVD